MGLSEQIISGARFERETHQFSVSSGNASGSISALDYTSILLSIAANNPCRIRLYSDSASRVTDYSRNPYDTNVLPAVSLITDAILDTELSLAFDPPVVAPTYNGVVWYNISSSATTNVSIRYFPIESEFATRSTIQFTGASIQTGSTGIGGNISAPNTFLILSGSSTVASRLRLYSKSISQVAASEISRQFTTLASASSGLIADMWFDTASVQYKMVPVYHAINLATLPAGNNTFGYQLANSSSIGTTDITASLYIYGIEE